jgi:hypothetical protein
LKFLNFRSLGSFRRSAKMAAAAAVVAGCGLDHRLAFAGQPRSPDERQRNPGPCRALGSPHFAGAACELRTCAIILEVPELSLVGFGPVRSAKMADAAVVAGAVSIIASPALVTV